MIEKNTGNMACVIEKLSNLGCVVSSLKKEQPGKFSTVHYQCAITI